MNIKFLLSFGPVEMEKTFYKATFEAFQPRADQGVLEHKTMNEMYGE
jgi:hypothetical protein